MNQTTDFQSSLAALADNARARAAETTTIKDLEAVEVHFLGRKGELTAVLRGLATVPADQRPAMGKLANEIKTELEAIFRTREGALKQTALEHRLRTERIDVTLPGTPLETGRIHPITQVLRRLKEVFIGLGFDVVDGPEVELERYNFEGLNIPEDHPSRDMWDSFYLGESPLGNLLLRSHTSPVQVRVMERQQPPVRVIVPGKCYRRDAVDATHSWEFHQIEGLLVDEGISFADLKGVLDTFARELFGKRRKTRFIPSYFPFTEPSAEMAIDCFVCEGTGCRMCKQSGWIEILGSGVVHPNVLERVGYDTERYTGFAFGMGVERIAMLAHGIDDIRLLYENDLRFLRQF
ncbi:MAG: phenylalanine--tRNA ligase subunit alpha [Proteobacteria bacterium]|nr:phenylalanine--tRNA ligase subunit alpha [Pseudomonadota bacterium]